MNKYPVFKLRKRISSLLASNLTKFLLANALYSLSTALITFLSPSFLRTEVYTDFIYLFQMVLFLTGIFTAGLVPGLLRYYKIDNQKYTFYYYLTAVILLIVLFLLGLFPNNRLSHALNITTESIKDNLIMYGSMICSLFFVYNRGYQTALCEYKKILKDVLVILSVRIVFLFVIRYYDISDPYKVLFFLCIVPFCYEFVVFVLSLLKLKICRLNSYPGFLGFIFKISIAGIIYTATSRLFIISSKLYDPTLAAALSFASGMTGIITIFNTTFSSVFIGKLDHRDPNGVGAYISKIRRFSLPFLMSVLLLGMGMFLFVTIIYPDNTMQAATISSLNIVHCALMSYVGLITLMTKTYNLLNIQILLNGLGFLIIYLFVKYLSVSLNEYVSYIIINAILLMMEIVLAFIVLRHIRNYNSTIGVGV